MLQKFPCDKINVTKNALFFVSWAPTHTHNSFNFKLRLLNKLKHKVCHYRLRFVFIKDYIFDQQNA